MTPLFYCCAVHTAHTPRGACRGSSPLIDSALLPGVRMSQTPRDLYPLLSRAERDRRWTAVRELLERENLDCLITPNNTGHSTHFQAESRYLTHCGGGGDADIACVFPLRGEVAAIATSAERWRDVQNWVTDLREARRAYGHATVEKLREVPLPRKRVGIVGREG